MRANAATDNRDRRAKTVVTWTLIVVMAASLLWIVLGNRRSPPDSTPARPSTRGTFALLASPTATGTLSLYVQAPGQAARPVTGEVGPPSWSPDGRRILTIRPSEASPALLIVDATTGRSTTLVGSGLPDEAEWSPAGGQIVFSTQYGDLWLIRPNGSGMRRLTDAHGSCADGGPSWSEGGDQIAFARACGAHGAPGIYLVKADGTGLRRVSDATNVFQTALSPDGREIAFAQHTDATDDVRLVGVDGTGSRLLARDANGPAWSPDGRAIAVVRAGTVTFLDPRGRPLGTLPAGTLHVQSFAWAT